MTDDWDRRCLMNILNGFYSSEVLKTGFSFSPSGTYKQINPESDQDVIAAFHQSIYSTKCKIKC